MSGTHAELGGFKFKRTQICHPERVCLKCFKSEYRFCLYWPKTILPIIPSYLQCSFPLTVSTKALSLNNWKTLEAMLALGKAMIILQRNQQCYFLCLFFIFWPPSPISPHQHPFPCLWYHQTIPCIYEFVLLICKLLLESIYKINLPYYYLISVYATCSVFFFLFSCFF